MFNFPVFLPLSEWEKFSEAFRRFVRTFQAGFGQSARVSTRGVASESGLPIPKMTKITIESDSLLILRGQSSTRAWCPQCGADVEMIALENVGVISNLDRTALEAWLNSGALHRSKADDGSALVCLNSLLARVRNTKPS
jgi:hypothetical protein